MSKGKFSIEEKIAKFTGRDRIKVEEIIYPYITLPSMSMEEMETLAVLYCQEKKLLTNSPTYSYLVRHEETKAALINSIMRRACSIALIRATTPEELEDYINQAVVAGLEYLENFDGKVQFYSGLTSRLTKALDEYTGKRFHKYSVDAVMDMESGGDSYLVTVKRNSETAHFFIIRDESVGEDSYVPEVHAEYSDLKFYVDQMLSTLTPREEGIIRLRFGFENGCNHSLEEVAVVYHTTRERIRQIEAKALRKLRHPRRANLVRGFWE